MPSAPQTVSTIVVFDYLYDESGVALALARIYVTLMDNRAVNNSPIVGIAPVRKTIETDTNGYWQMSLASNVNLTPTGTTYLVETPYSTYQISVPATGGPYQTSAIAVS